MDYPAPVQNLIAQLARLPGIGKRSAERIALHLLKANGDTNRQLAQSVYSALHFCASPVTWRSEGPSLQRSFLSAVNAGFIPAAMISSFKDGGQPVAFNRGH